MRSWFDSADMPPCSPLFHSTFFDKLFYRPRSAPVEAVLLAVFFSFHAGLCGDAGVVGAREPEGFLPFRRARRGKVVLQGCFVEMWPVQMPQCRLGVGIMYAWGSFSGYGPAAGRNRLALDPAGCPLSATEAVSVYAFGDFRPQWATVVCAGCGSGGLVCTKKRSRSSPARERVKGKKALCQSAPLPPGSPVLVPLSITASRKN